MIEDVSADRMERGLRLRALLIRSLLTSVFLLVIAGFTVKVLFLELVEVADQSMYPSIEYGSSILCWVGGEPVIGDTVLVEFGDRLALRRILATGGSTVRHTSEGIEIDGTLMEREQSGEHDYLNPGASAGSVSEMICRTVVEVIGSQSVELCIDERSELVSEPFELVEDEIYVRCDNRAYCARRAVSEGPVTVDRVSARARWLLSTRDDSDEPFYKRWFGRFESLQ